MYKPNYISSSVLSDDDKRCVEVCQAWRVRLPGEAVAACMHKELKNIWQQI